MTAADVLLPMISTDDNTHHMIDCGKETFTLPVHEFRYARKLLKPGRSISAVPRNEDGLPRRQGVLWVECESRKQMDRLGGLPVPPSVILKDSGRVACTALWWLSEPLEPVWMPGLARTWGEEANRRLAHAVGAAKKWCDAEFLIPVRGVHRVVVDRFSARDVVGRLRAAPTQVRWAA